MPYGDAEALAAAVTDETAAVLLEPIQGEAGVVVPPAGYLAAARRIATDARRPALARRGADRHRPHRALVRAADARPASHADIVTVAKGLAGGFPIGACLGLGDAGDAARSPATTAPPSAATRSPARPRSP